MIRRHPQRTPSRYLQQVSEKAASCGTVAVLAEHRVDEGSVAIDRSVEVAPAAGDLHVGLVEVPGGADAPATPRAELMGDQGDRLVLRPPPSSFTRMPRSTRSLMSRKAVSGEDFVSAAHLLLVSLPSKPSSSRLMTVPATAAIGTSRELLAQTPADGFPALITSLPEGEVHYGGPAAG